MRLLVLLLFLLPASAGELFNKKIAVLEDFPREVGRGRKIQITGLRIGAYKTPELIVIAPNGRTYKTTEGIFGEYRFTYDIEFTEGIGAYRMELILRTNRGVKSAARFTIWYGKRRPKVEKRKPLPTGPMTPVELHPWLIEKRMFRSFQEFRKKIRLPEISWNEAVAARARDHASKMARSKRRLHKFGGKGVKEHMSRDGAGKWAPESGPDGGWPRVTSVRPFDRPSLLPTGPHVLNHVVQQNVAGQSWPVLFETFWVREAAFLLLAADPNCVEIGIGVARETDGNPKNLYFCVCFVQVNDKPTHNAQETAFLALNANANATLAPVLLRRLGLWSRPSRSASTLAKAMRSHDARVRAATWDARMYLNEEKTRSKIAESLKAARRAARLKRYGNAYAKYLAISHTTADTRIRKLGQDGAKSVLAAAKAERKSISDDSKLEDWKRRCAGMPDDSG